MFVLSSRGNRLTRCYREEVKAKQNSVVRQARERPSAALHDTFLNAAAIR